MTADPRGLVHEARRLDAEARGHKGAIARHRQALQQVRARQAEIERQCVALGIVVTYQPHPTHGAGDHPWPQQTRTVPHAPAGTPSSTSRR